MSAGIQRRSAPTEDGETPLALQVRQASNGTTSSEASLCTVLATEHSSVAGALEELTGVAAHQGTAVDAS